MVNANDDWSGVDAEASAWQYSLNGLQTRLLLLAGVVCYLLPVFAGSGFMGRKDEFPHPSKCYMAPLLATRC